jgi:hypothetical protein
VKTALDDGVGFSGTIDQWLECLLGECCDGWSGCLFHFIDEVTFVEVDLGELVIILRKITTDALVLIKS